MPAQQSKGPHRHNRSFLALAEQWLIGQIVPRLPARMTSLHLTMIGMVGAFVSAFALIGANWSRGFVALLIVGVLMNWFGDSLDGSLARYRKEERPRFGFLVDHTCDLFAQILVIVAFGLSPYLSLVSALTILLCYLLFSAYTYIRAAAHHIHQMSYVGVGATEFRILMIVWGIVGATFDLREPLVNGISTLDFVILILACFSVVGLGYKAILDAREVALQEGATPYEERNQAVEAKTVNS